MQRLAKGRGRCQEPCQETPCRIDVLVCLGVMHRHADSLRRPRNCLFCHNVHVATIIDSPIGDKWKLSRPRHHQNQTWRIQPAGDDHLRSALRTVIGERSGALSVPLGKSVHTNEFVYATFNICRATCIKDGMMPACAVRVNDAA